MDDITEETREDSGDIQDSKDQLDNISNIINATMGAVINMGGEVNNIRSEVVLALEGLKQMIQSWEQRLTETEQLKRDQLLASDEQLDKIKKLEYEGFELTGTNLVANLLGTLNLVYEIMGKLETNVSRIDGRLNIIDQRSTENLMEMKVIIEQQRNVLGEITDIKIETVRLREHDKKLQFKQLTVFLVIFLILASLFGVQTFINSIRGI